MPTFQSQSAEKERPIKKGELVRSKFTGEICLVVNKSNKTDMILQQVTAGYFRLRGHVDHYEVFRGTITVAD